MNREWRHPNNRPKEDKELGIKILKTIPYEWSPEDRYIGGERCQMARKFGSQKSADVTLPEERVKSSHVQISFDVMKLIKIGRAGGQACAHKCAPRAPAMVMHPPRKNTYRVEQKNSC